MEGTAPSEADLSDYKAVYEFSSNDPVGIYKKTVEKAQTQGAAGALGSGLAEALPFAVSDVAFLFTRYWKLLFKLYSRDSAALGEKLAPLLACPSQPSLGSLLSSIASSGIIDTTVVPTSESEQQISDLLATDTWRLSVVHLTALSCCCTESTAQTVYQSLLLQSRTRPSPQTLSLFERLLVLYGGHWKSADLWGRYSVLRQTTPHDKTLSGWALPLDIAQFMAEYAKKRSAEAMKSAWATFAQQCAQSLQTPALLESPDSALSYSFTTLLAEVQKVYSTLDSAVLAADVGKRSVLTRSVLLLGDENGTVFFTRKVIAKLLKLLAPTLRKAPTDADPPHFVRPLLGTLAFAAETLLDNLKQIQSSHLASSPSKDLAFGVKIQASSAIFLLIQWPTVSGDPEVAPIVEALRALLAQTLDLPTPMILVPQESDAVGDVSRGKRGAEQMTPPPDGESSEPPAKRAKYRDIENPHIPANRYAKGVSFRGPAVRNKALEAQNKLDQHDATLQIDESLVSALLNPTVPPVRAASPAVPTEPKAESAEKTEQAVTLQALELQQKMMLQKRRAVTHGGVAPPPAASTPAPLEFRPPSASAPSTDVASAMRQLVEVLNVDAIFEIVSSLKQLQADKEFDIAVRRNHIEKQFDLRREELSRLHLQRLATAGLGTTDKLFHRNAREKTLLQEERQAELARFDARALAELDEKALEQQVTLQKAGVPLFGPTQDQRQLSLQSKVLAVILEQSELRKRSRQTFTGRGGGLQQTVAVQALQDAIADTSSELEKELAGPPKWAIKPGEVDAVALIPVLQENPTLASRLVAVNPQLANSILSAIQVQERNKAQIENVYKQQQEAKVLQRVHEQLATRPPPQAMPTRFGLQPPPQVSFPAAQPILFPPQPQRLPPQFAPQQAAPGLPPALSSLLAGVIDQQQRGNLAALLGLQQGPGLPQSLPPPMLQAPQQPQPVAGNMQNLLSTLNLLAGQQQQPPGGVNPIQPQPGFYQQQPWR